MHPVNKTFCPFETIFCNILAMNTLSKFIVFSILQYVDAYQTRRVINFF